MVSVHHRSTGLGIADRCKMANTAVHPIQSAVQLPLHALRHMVLACSAEGFTVEKDVTVRLWCDRAHRPLL